MNFNHLDPFLNLFLISKKKIIIQYPVISEMNCILCIKFFPVLGNMEKKLFIYMEGNLLLMSK